MEKAKQKNKPIKELQIKGLKKKINVYNAMSAFLFCCVIVIAYFAFKTLLLIWFFGLLLLVILMSTTIILANVSKIQYNLWMWFYGR